MDQTDLWQPQIVKQLTAQFKTDADIKAVILCGSLATDRITADRWSDVDLRIVLADHASGRYWHTLNWLQPYGTIIGVEKHEHPLAKTLRVCLDDFKRLDFVFVPQSAVGEQDLLAPPAAVLWSRSPHLPNQTATTTHATPAAPLPISPQTITQFADPFWYKASAAIAKVMRNDRLIGFHLALDLARDVLVLQMIRRDQALQTNIHRTGGWGNELTGRFALNHAGHSAIGILNFIAENGQLFDELAQTISPTYTPRLPLLMPAIETAKGQSHSI